MPGGLPVLRPGWSRHDGFRQLYRLDVVFYGVEYRMVNDDEPIRAMRSGPVLSVVSCTVRGIRPGR